MPKPAAEVQITSLAGLQDIQAHNVQVDLTNHEGIDAIRVMELSGEPHAGEDRLAILPDTHFQNGLIVLDIAGSPIPGAQEAARGFVGVGFRVAADVARFECFYIRPTNGRADDQLRRNHSTRYFSFPDHPWRRLREETPGLYESYSDLVPSQWTSLRIEVTGDKARLYVGASDQPVLLVNDLKHGESEGNIALWIGPGTEGYFANLQVSP